MLEKALAFGRHHALPTMSPSWAMLLPFMAQQIEPQVARPTSLAKG